MSFLQQLLIKVSHGLTSSFPDVSQGLESVNYCTFASCFQGVDITASCFSENWLQQMGSSEDLRICDQKHSSYKYHSKLSKNTCIGEN